MVLESIPDRKLQYQREILSVVRHKMSEFLNKRARLAEEATGAAVLRVPIYCSEMAGEEGASLGQEKSKFVKADVRF